MWPDGYYVGTNENNVAAYALERSQMLIGAPAGLQRFTAPDLGGFSFQMITPADLDGACRGQPVRFGSRHFRERGLQAPVFVSSCWMLRVARAPRRQSRVLRFRPFRARRLSLK